jgi:hypothetical protein
MTHTPKRGCAGKGCLTQYHVAVREGDSHDRLAICTLSDSSSIRSHLSSKITAWVYTCNAVEICAESYGLEGRWNRLQQK